MKEGYFEELVLKKEAEPKHFRSASLTILTKFLVLQRQVLGTTEDLALA